MEHLKALSFLILKAMDPARKSLASVQSQDPDSFVEANAFERVTQSLNRVERIARFMGSLLFKPHQLIQLDEHMSSGAPLDASEDSVWLVGYTGKQNLEKGLHEIVGKTPFWSKLVDEVVRTASSTLRLRPHRDRAAETLAKIEAGDMEMNSVRLESLAAVFGELHSGMRACEVEDVNNKMLEQMHKIAKSLIKGEVDVGQGSKLVHALMKAFKVFSAWPGSTDKIKDLSTWMTANEKEMTLEDLMSLSEKSEVAGVANLDDVQAIMGKLNKVTLPQERPELILAAKRLLNTSLRAVIAEAGESGEI